MLTGWSVSKTGWKVETRKAYIQTKKIITRYDMLLCELWLHSEKNYECCSRSNLPKKKKNTRRILAFSWAFDFRLGKFWPLLQVRHLESHFHDITSLAFFDDILHLFWGWLANFFQESRKCVSLPVIDLYIFSWHDVTYLFWWFFLRVALTFSGSLGSAFLLRSLTFDAVMWQAYCIIFARNQWILPFFNITHIFSNFFA